MKSPYSPEHHTMHYYFITGSSKGIGRALTAAILRRRNVHVTGLSRSNSFAEPAFSFQEIDLSDIEAVIAFQFPDLSDAETMHLVNNAGAVGQVGYSGKVNDVSLESVLNINLTAAVILTNKFIAAYASRKIPIVIMNISSGAGKNPIDGWAAYCASKAGLDMYSRVVAEELAIGGQKHVRIFSVAPGIVDTGMQDQIRAAEKQNFSRIQQFLEYKTSGQLADPEAVAAKLLSILDLPEKFAETVFSAKDITVNQHTNQ